MCPICLLLSLKIASRRRLVNLACVEPPPPRPLEKKNQGGSIPPRFFLRGEWGVCT